MLRECYVGAEGGGKVVGVLRSAAGVLRGC